VLRQCLATDKMAAEFLLGRFKPATIRHYNRGWRNISKAYAEQNGDQSSDVRGAEPICEALTDTLLHLAAALAKSEAGFSKYSHAAAAIAHVMDALRRKGSKMLTNTSKAFSSANPPSAKHSTTPDIHEFLDIVATMQGGEKAARAKCAALLLLLGTKRPSDITRVFIHPLTLKFDVVQFPTPSSCPRPDDNLKDMVRLLGFALQRKRTGFLRMHIRPFKPKTCNSKKSHFGDWTEFVEYTSDANLCPVRATLQYMQFTHSLQKRKGMKLDKGFTMLQANSKAIPASTLMLSLNGESREAIKATTLSGIIGRTLLTPLQITTKYTPYVTRSCSASHLIAYGVDKAVVLHRGSWASDSAFEKYYRVQLLPRIDPQRLSDALPPEWKILRAHSLLKTSATAFMSLSRSAKRNSNSMRLSLRSSKRQRGRRSSLANL